jgi:hypothetical protein
MMLLQFVIYFRAFLLSVRITVVCSNKLKYLITHSFGKYNNRHGHGSNHFSLGLISFMSTGTFILYLFEIF